MTSGAFPRLLRERQTGESGVNAVSVIVNDKLKWIFRRVSLEHDFGLEGYIDIVNEDGGITGQSIAVQIKTGKFFFASQAVAGFTFHGETKHLNYYMNLPMPVLIVLHEPQENRCYWTMFDIKRTEPASRGSKITVPKNNILSEDSKGALLEIVGPAVEHEDAVKAHWALNETMQAFDSIFYAVDREDVESGNTRHLKDFVERFSLNDTLCRKFQGRVELTISGYDEDPRELYEIPEVVRWYEGADPVFKYWFFFCWNEPPASGLHAYWACMCSAKRTPERSKSPNKIRLELDKTKLLATLKVNFLRLNELTDRLGMSEEENKRISFIVMDALELPHGD